jgi:hypothetical protein
MPKATTKRGFGRGEISTRTYAGIKEAGIEILQYFVWSKSPSGMLSNNKAASSKVAKQQLRSPRQTKPDAVHPKGRRDPVPDGRASYLNIAAERPAPQHFQPLKSCFRVISRVNLPMIVFNFFSHILERLYFLVWAYLFCMISNLLLVRT